MSRHPFQRSLLTLAAVGLLATTVAACGSKSEDSMGYSTSGRQRNAALTSSQTRTANTVSLDMGLYSSIALDETGSIRTWGYEEVGQNEVPPLRDGGTKFTTINSGGFHTLALDDLGQMYAWGYNGFGEINIPKLQGTATKFTTLAGGLFQSLALDDLGQMYLWGSNYFGENDIPALRDGGTKFTSIASGSWHNLAIDDVGNLYAWGSNEYGELDIPKLESGATRFTSVAAGFFHSLALDDLGNMYTWGYNPHGQATVPALKEGGTKFTYIQASELASAALDDAGNAYIMSNISITMSAIPELTNGGTKFVSINTGYASANALDDKGNIYGWGESMFGELNTPDALTYVVPAMPIAMGGSQSYGIHEDGYIVKFDGSSDGWAYPAESNFVSIAAGSRHGLAIDTSGYVTAWGDGFAGQTSVPEGLTNVVQVAAGYAYSAALRSDGSVVEWGSHTAPKGKMIDMPDSLPALSAIAGGLTHILGLTRTGSVVGWGNNDLDKATPPELTDVISIAANSTCSAALKSDGSIVYWGGCLEAITATDNVKDATDIVLTDYSAVVLKGDGSIQTWGEGNDWTQILNAPETGEYMALSAGHGAVMAVTATGDVVTWGYNMGYPITIPSTFGGLDPEEGEDCGDCEYPDPAMFTDEMLMELGKQIRGLLSDAQLAVFVKALGGTYSSTMTPEEIDKLIKAASEAERTAALAVINQQVTPLTEVKTAELPASQSPLTKVGTKITTKQAVRMLGLKKATKVSFVVPKKKSASCAVTKSAVTTSAAGTCNVQVKYTQKKKVKKSILTLVIG